MNVNGQQRPLAMPAVLVLVEVVATTTVATARAVVFTSILPMLTVPILSANFYIYNTESCKNQKLKIYYKY